MKNMIIIDLETQDFSVTTGIYEVACLVVENGEIVDELYLGKEIRGYFGDNKYGFGFHNIARDNECIKIFKDFLLKYPYPLVAHNCPFDRKFLVYYNWVEESLPMYCSMRAIRYELKGLKSYSMDNLKCHFGVDSIDAHTAMGDVIALSKILVQISPKQWLYVGQAAPKRKKTF